MAGRHVPVDISCLGEKANTTRPEIEQILISNSQGSDEEKFERDLYIIRRRIEKAVTCSANKRFLCLFIILQINYLQRNDAC